MKTISDVVKQMRHCADEIELTNCYDLRSIGTDALRVWADKIEETVTSCNSLMMREALKEILATLSVYHTSSLSNQETVDTFENVIEQALSAPPRNCDRFEDYGDAIRAFGDEGYDYETIEEWLFDKAKGETKWR